MSDYVLRLYREAGRALRFETLPSTSLDQASEVARRRLLGSSFVRSEVLGGGRVLRQYRRSGGTGEVLSVPVFHVEDDQTGSH
jgi:hypothetical protein